MTRTDRFAQTTAIVAIALVSAAWLVFPAWEFSVLLFGRTISATVSSAWQFGALAIALGLVGVQGIIGAEPRPWHELATFWALPASVLAAAVVLIDLLTWPVGGMVVALGATASFATITALQVKAQGENSPTRLLVRQLLNLAAYACVGLLFFAIARSEAGVALSVLGTVLVAIGLASEIFRNGDAPPRDVWVYAALAGLVVGELELALAFVNMPPRMMAGVLFLAFYAAVGLAQQGLLGRLNSRVLAEYAVIALGGLMFLYWVFR